ncbi:MAG: arylesterase [Betaproteobacteria bacterium]
MAVAAGAVGYFSTAAQAQAATAPASHGKAKAPRATTIVVLGDSLSAEYGLRRGTGWVALLEQKLKRESIAATVINASISGDTSSGGRARLGALLEQHHPTHVIIELGGNDALRGLSLQATEDNLDQMTKAAQKAGAKVVLVGMQVPPNYGAAYGEQFASLFGQVARTHNAALVPFLLKGVADGEDPTRWFQSDRIHPLAEAHPIMLANVWLALRKLLP